MSIGQDLFRERRGWGGVLGPVASGYWALRGGWRRGELGAGEERRWWGEDFGQTRSQTAPAERVPDSCSASSRPLVCWVVCQVTRTYGAGIPAPNHLRLKRRGNGADIPAAYVRLYRRTVGLIGRLRRTKEESWHDWIGALRQRCGAS